MGSQLQYPLIVLVAVIFSLTCPHAAFSESLESGEQLYKYQPSVTPKLAFKGEFDVGVTTRQLVNPAQIDVGNSFKINDRALQIEIWYPAQSSEKAAAIYTDQTRSGRQFSLQGNAVRDAPPLPLAENVAGSGHPLVILSHGYTGYRTMMFYLAENLASHGYLVAAIDHTDSTNADVDFSVNPQAGFLSTLVNRSRDQQFVLDTLAELDDPIIHQADTDRAAILGFSMGGYGAINTVGGCYRYSEALLMAFGLPQPSIPQLLPLMNICNGGRGQVDPRWKAMIAMAPWGGDQKVHDISALNRIQVPALYVAGDQDDISGYQSMHQLYRETGSDHRYLLVYENARHNIAAHPAPRKAYDNEPGPWTLLRTQLEYGID